MKVKSLSHVRLFMTPWTAAHQAPPSMGFSRQEYWSGLPLPSPIYCYIQVDGFFFFTSAAQRNHQNRQVQVPPHWGVMPIPFLCLASILTNHFSMSSPTCYAMSVIVNFMLEKKKKSRSTEITETENRMVVARSQRRGMGRWWLKGTNLQLYKFWGSTVKQGDYS